MTKLRHGHVPAYVGVYNSLYSDIINNVYLENSQLPPESALASHYGVSRATLRQALAILNEDGLIVKSQGKGTVIAERGGGTVYTKITNPLSSMCRHRIDSTSITYNYGPPTDIARSKLGLKRSEIVLATIMTYYVDGTSVGYSFTQVPVSSFEELHVDTSCEEGISHLVGETIYSRAARSLMDVKLIYANELEQETLGVEANKPLILLESVLYDEHHSPFARTKLYLRAEYYTLSFAIGALAQQRECAKP